MNEKAFWEDLKSGRFASMVSEAAVGETVSGAAEVYNITKPLFAQEDDVESIWVLFLNGQNHITAMEKMFTGSVSSSMLYPRELIKRILKHKATAIVLVHNHPAGTTEPSADDLLITKKVMWAVQCIEVLLHDHIIVGAGRYHSMADRGTIHRFKTEIDEFGRKC